MTAALACGRGRAGRSGGCRGSGRTRRGATQYGGLDGRDGVVVCVLGWLGGADGVLSAATSVGQARVQRYGCEKNSNEPMIGSARRWKEVLEQEGGGGTFGAARIDENAAAAVWTPTREIGGLEARFAGEREGKRRGARGV